ncbi:MFS transporter [Micromonospora sp. WMMD710]|uniref:MFS transporter n=1 Tax=Micromonospora sp. WMMD710 TaxID=3016085 RepID=UPI002415CAFF|nr:MFS transporter [Micromonospora sp. WMMD710]MDG4760473.1 MFS transporter [Micromonospora sp. WMMD710]
MTAPASTLTLTSTASSVVRSGSPAGWQLGVLYGPAVYGVSAAAVALPDAATHLHANAAGLAWILTAYAAGVGVGAVTAGRLTDLWGTRRVLLSAAALLTLGALICAVAPTLHTVVIGRVLLATGSGAVMAAALASTARLPAAHRRASMATFGACMAGFAATAPLAGALAAHWSWRAALILPVLSIAAIPSCWPLTAPATQHDRLDWPGAGLLAAVAAGLLLTAQTAPHTSALTTAILAAATAAAALGLAARTRIHPGGFLTRGILSAGWFHKATIIGAGVYAALFAVLYTAPHLLNQQGYSTMQIGVLLLPGAVIGAALARLAALAARRLPARHVLAAVSVILAATMLNAAITPRPWTIVATATAAFTASAITQMLLTTHVTAHTAVESRGGVSGLLTLATFLGGGCGTALCATLWQTWGPAAALAVVAIAPALGALAARRIR